MLIPLPAFSDHQSATGTVEARPAVSMKKTGRFFSECPDWANSKLLKIFTFGFSKEMVTANSFSVKLRVNTPCICNGFNQLSRDSFLSMSRQSRTTLPLGKPSMRDRWKQFGENQRCYRQKKISKIKPYSQKDKGGYFIQNRMTANMAV